MLLYLLYHRALGVDGGGFLRSQRSKEKLAVFLQLPFDGGEEIHRKRGGLPENEAVAHLEGLCYERGYAVVRLSEEFQANRLELLALLYKVGHYIAEVNIVVVQTLVDGDICISGHSENAAGDYLEILEHLLSVMADKLLDKQELSRSREPHQLRKILRRGKYPERYLARGVVLFAYRYADVYLAALEERHRVLFVYNSGEQERLYLAGEERAEVRVLFRGEVLNSEVLNAVIFQTVHYRGIRVVLDWQELLYALRDLHELLLCGHVGLVFSVLAVKEHFIVQAAYSYHKEFVEVGAEYLHESQPFEQRSFLVECLFKHPRIELEPRKLTVVIEFTAHIKSFHSCFICCLRRIYI